MTRSADNRIEKYLPALKCLLAAQAVDADNPKCKELSDRLKETLGKLEEPLPPKVKEVMDSAFMSKS